MFPEDILDQINSGVILWKYFCEDYPQEALQLVLIKSDIIQRKNIIKELKINLESCNNNKEEELKTVCDYIYIISDMTKSFFDAIAESMLWSANLILEEIDNDKYASDVINFLQKMFIIEDRNHIKE